MNIASSDAMSHLRLLLHLGDLGLVMPAAAAIGTALLAARGWRMALWWGLLFGLGAALVGASKIAFLGWGGGWPALSFKSFSGHATGAMAVLPMLSYLLLYSLAPRLRHAGAGAGVLLALCVALLLVLFGEHSTSEALAGCLLGAMASMGSLYLGSPLAGQAGAQPALRPRPCPRRLLAVVLAALTFIALAWLMKSAHIGYWMMKAARALSGNHQLYPLSPD